MCDALTFPVRVAKFEGGGGCDFLLAGSRYYIAPKKRTKYFEN